MSANDDDALARVKAAMKDPEVRIRIVQTFTHGKAAQVFVKSRKVSPLIFPAEGQSLGDVLSMLGDFADGAA